MNIFCFTGNLGKDAELRTTQSGTSVLTFSVAVKAGYGENEKTSWVRCSMFGKRAEGNLSSYLVKGQQVAVSGEFSLDEWQDQQGQKNTMAQVRVNDVTLVGERKQGGQAPRQQAPQQQPQGGFVQPPQGGFQQQPPQQQGYNNQASQQSQKPPGGFDDFDSDIPF